MTGQRQLRALVLIALVLLISSIFFLSPSEVWGEEEAQKTPSEVWEKTPLSSLDWEKEEALPISSEDWVKEEEAPLTSKEEEEAPLTSEETWEEEEAPLTTEEEEEAPLTSLSDIDVDVDSTLRKQFPHRLFPRALIIGNQKCGSTTLDFWIKQHPLVAPSAKEIFYFGHKRLNDAEYAWQFMDCLEHDCTDRFSLDGSVTTSSTAGSAEHIKQKLPDVKLIFMVRNPIERAYSKFKMDIRNLQKHKHTDFQEMVTVGLPLLNETLRAFEAWSRDTSGTIWDFQKKATPREFGVISKYQALSGSLYSVFLEPFMKVFPREQFLFIHTEELELHPEKVMKEVFQFLEVPYVELKATSLNVYKNGTSEISPKTRQVLKDFFRPYNKRFNKMAGTRFDLDE